MEAGCAAANVAVAALPAVGPDVVSVVGGAVIAADGDGLAAAPIGRGTIGAAGAGAAVVLSARAGVVDVASSAASVPAAGADAAANPIASADGAGFAARFPEVPAVAGSGFRACRSFRSSVASQPDTVLARREELLRAVLAECFTVRTHRWRGVRAGKAREDKQFMAEPAWSRNVPIEVCRYDLGGWIARRCSRRGASLSIQFVRSHGSLLTRLIFSSRLK